MVPDHQQFWTMPNVTKTVPTLPPMAFRSNVAPTSFALGFLLICQGECDWWVEAGVSSVCKGSWEGEHFLWYPYEWQPSSWLTSIALKSLCSGDWRSRTKVPEGLCPEVFREGHSFSLAIVGDGQHSCLHDIPVPTLT